MSTHSSSSHVKFDEQRWIIQIRRTLDEELEEDTEIPVSIFSVAKILMASDPDSYIPQQVALGPYHYWRHELYEMQRYKISAAKKMQKQLQNVKFQDMVDQVIKHEHRVRACYHKYLDFSGETLAWMMAVDASFLLEFLQVYAVKEGRTLTRVTSRMSHLVDVTGRKSAHHAILKDMVMLENQIPLFILRKMLEFQFLSLELADGMLMSMLMGLCKEIIPFKMMEDLPNLQITESAHLLDFLFRVMVPRAEYQRTSEITDQVEENQEDEIKTDREETTGNGNSRSCIRKCIQKIWKLVCAIKRALYSRPVKFMIKLPWTIISNLPGTRILKQSIEYLCSQDREKQNLENEKSNLNNVNKPPLIEEITIPSVTELSEVGITFLPADGGIYSISFDTKTLTFTLPTISLEENTEVILRNLVAYEACNASGPLVFARYTELMNGIIDTEDDAKLLRARGIIMNRLRSDEEVAHFWNGMSRSVRLTKVPFLDKVIEDVNKYYNSRWRVKLGKFMKVHVFESWRSLTLLAAIMILLLMALQAFCSVYGCGRTRRVKSMQ